MKRQRILKVTIVIILLAIIVTEGFLLYYIKSMDKQNVITVGKVVATLSEPEEEEPVTHCQVKAGDTLKRDAKIILGSESEMAYLRVMIQTEGLSGKQKRELRQGIKVSEAWNYNETEGYYYYKGPVYAEDEILIFDEVTIPECWAETEGIEFQMDVAVEAVQANYLTPVINAACNIVGWNQTEGMIQAKSDR